MSDQATEQTTDDEWARTRDRKANLAVADDPQNPFACCDRLRQEHDARPWEARSEADTERRTICERAT